MSASIANSTAARSARCLCTRVKSSSGVMGSPLVKLICVRAISVAKRVARQFVAHRHSIWRTGIRGVSLPDTLAARGKTLGHWCARAVGAFYCCFLFHASSVFFLPFFVSPKHP